MWRTCFEKGGSSSPTRLGRLTILPRVPLPRVDDILDALQGASVYSTLALTSGYHQMRLKQNSRSLTAFQADGELFHTECIALGGAVCKPPKVHLAQSAITFLGHRISGSTITLDPAKPAAMQEQQAPRNRHDFQRFLSRCGYYRRFLPAYAELVQPLSELLKKSNSWRWGALHTTTFERVKEMLQRSPVLRLPDFTRQFFVTKDASDIAAGGVLSQIHPTGEHPVAYLSRKLSDTERRWPAHEKELFAIKFCLEKWRPYLLGSMFTVYTDSIACKWFFTKKQSSPKLLRWFDLFGQFTFEVHHRVGRTNVVADILSRPIQSSAVLVTEPDPAFATRIKEL
ncbi:Retroelement [Phytophthora megakarya]|uniref:Retroelement n=1 Tax=Phytophthora megakarya TaxID=4795 RepID=A0A225WAY5_9STRA|nr:Retroelement [Phytophthora megakarya]